MKKKFKIYGLIILILLAILIVFKIREFNDAHAEFELDDNKFILEYIDIPEKDGRVSSNYYYEVNLETKIVDYRHEVYYFDDRVTNWFEKNFGNKKRKLKHRYYINDDTTKQLQDVFIEFSTNDFQMDDKEFTFGYYFLKTNKGNFKITDINQINKILTEIKK